nr:PREDICTED: adhesion G-protein coupled receptor G5-like [Latimeria chalumnae]|eukprot:XP_014352383.1 PREDICTED: adhesion G-protein coupled receptor G5-like [Latimeria chalumnae]
MLHVRYDASISDTAGRWNSTGCYTSKTQNETICSCNHLTYFAVLLGSRTAIDAAVLTSLTYITYVGCSITVFSLLIVLILSFLSRNLHSDYSSKIHVHLAAALLLLNLSFLLNEWLTSFQNDGLCKAIAVILHFSLLSTFTWMGIEGFHLYMLLVKVYNTYVRHYIVKLGIVGWGLPVSLVSLILIIKKEAYGFYAIQTEGSYKNASMCWITDPTVHYVTNVGYFGCIFVSNTIILVIMALKLLNLTSANRPRWKDACMILGFTSLLGITWGLAFFSFGSLLLPQLYLFTIINSLQGFFVLLWYCALRRQKKKASSNNTTQATVGAENQ